MIDRWGGVQNVPLGPPTFLDASTGFFTLSPSDDPSGPQTLVFGTRDSGQTWTRLTSLSVLLAGPIAFVDARHWHAVEQGLPSVVKVTDDGGSSWRDLPAAGLSAGSLELLSMLDARHGAAVLLVAGDSGMPAILMLTSDGGESWRPAAGLPAAGPSPTSVPSPVR